MPPPRHVYDAMLMPYAAAELLPLLHAFRYAARTICHAASYAATMLAPPYLR